MQNKYNNIKQNVNEKIKKYVERFNVILKQLNKIKRRDSNDKLQNFIRNFRLNHQFELYKHLRYVNQQNLKTTVQRFKNAKYYRNKHNKKKKKKKKSKRSSYDIENFKFNKKSKNNKKNKNNDNNDFKKKNINDKKSQLYR